ncbi:hypothetical protein [Azospirillum thermophilum]|uniref:hypothetical protein n=1 Tax=Azospirillum thermophilum TaxID=2202148 RepID=UPI001FE3876A|nr:hypothetical protein [Azospirillum thermophilum]
MSDHPRDDHGMAGIPFERMGPAMSKLDPEVVIDMTPAKKAAIPPLAPGLLLALSDGFVLALVGWVLSHILVQDPADIEAELGQRSLVTGLMLVPLVKSVFGIYSLGRFDYLERTRRTFQAAMLCCAVLAVPFIVLDGFRPFFMEALSVALIGFAATYAADLILVHGLMASALQWRTPVVIVGAGPQGAAIAAKLQRLPWLGMRPVGFFDDDADLWQTRIEGLPVFGPVELLAKSPAFAQQAQAAIVADIGRQAGRQGVELT